MSAPEGDVGEDDRVLPDGWLPVPAATGRPVPPTASAREAG